MNRTAELRQQMTSLDDQLDAGEITNRERGAAYGRLNDEYRALTGCYWTPRMIDPIHVTVNHNRARQHGR